jgi:AcrR family transcriptional regulator
MIMTENRKEGLIKLFINTFCLYGLDGTTTKRLAEEANLSEAGLYVHFKNKEDILINCVEVHFRKVKETTEQLLKKYDNKMDEFGYAMFEYVKSMVSENRFILQVLSHPYFQTVIKGEREYLANGLIKQASVLEKQGVSREKSLALILLFNSALNNYILNQDEESFLIQLNYIINAFKQK